MIHRSKERAREVVLCSLIIAQLVGVTLGQAEDAYLLRSWVSYGKNCSGFWSPWSRCQRMCYRNRTFTKTFGDCSGLLEDGAYDYIACFFEDCVMPADFKSPIVKNLRRDLSEVPVGTFWFEQFGMLIEHVQSGGVGLLMVVLLVVAFVKSMDLAWLPDIAVAIPMAAVTALVIRYWGFNGASFGPAANKVYSTFVKELMNHLLLPILLFESAFHLQRRNFFAQLIYGLMFAILGTGMCIVLIAVMVKFTGDAGWHRVGNWREAITYASFMADIDPVTTLSIFSSLKVDPLLSILVSGESTLNDPLSIVIFEILNAPTKSLELELTGEILSGAIELFGSIFVGLSFGLVFTVLIPVFKIYGRGSFESLYFFLCAYASYSFGESIHMSGIISTLFCGMMMGVYAKKLVEDFAVVDKFLENIAKLADIVIFMIIGFGVFLIDDWTGVSLGFLSIFFCIIARGISTVCVVTLVNSMKRARGQKPISFGIAFMIFHSGLRGGMTVMLALMIDPYWSDHSNELVVATFICVISMTYLCGCTAPFFLRITGVPTGVSQGDGDLFHDDTPFGGTLLRVHAAIRTKLGIEGKHKLVDAKDDEEARRIEENLCDDESSE